MKYFAAITSFALNAEDYNLLHLFSSGLFFTSSIYIADSLYCYL